jgi:hypothetical protein
MHSSTQTFFHRSSASRAVYAGAPGVHEIYKSTSFFRFVPQELPEHPKPSIHCTLSKPTVFNHKVKFKVFESDERVSIHEFSSYFMPEVSSLVGDFLMDFSHVSSNFFPSVTTFFTPTQSSLRSSQFSLSFSKPTRVPKNPVVRERQQPVDSYINTNWILGPQLNVRIRSFDLQTSVPLSKSSFYDNVFNSRTCGQWSVLLNFNSSDIQDVESPLILMKAYRFSMCEWDTVEPVDPFKSGIPWFLPTSLFQSTKETLKSLVQSSKNLLSGVSSQNVKPFHLFTDLPESLTLVCKAQRFSCRFVVLLALLKTLIVHKPSSAQDFVKRFLLHLSRIETVFEGPFHYSVPDCVSYNVSLLDPKVKSTAFSCIRFLPSWRNLLFSMRNYYG